LLAGLPLGVRASAATPASAALGTEDIVRRAHELDRLLHAGNTRALDHLAWLERWAATAASGEAQDLLRQIEALDFPAALGTLRGLGEDAFRSS
jgi:hypothetical protein